MPGLATAEWRRQVLAALGLGAQGGSALWTPLRGGRVNRVWRVEGLGPALAVKLYGARSDRGLFPNRPEQEFAALQAVHAAGLGPKPRKLLAGPAGTVLVYEFVPDDTPLQTRQAAGLLARLHRMRPWRGLGPPAPDRWRVRPRDLARLPGVRAPARMAIARALRGARGFRHRPCPVHGDPVPANIVARGAGPVLIDWQCPHLGDPVTDLALYLSPAMQTIYASGPLEPQARCAFLSAYGNPHMTARYLRRAPVLHARIALHCAARSDHAALQAEIRLLNELGEEAAR